MTKAERFKAMFNFKETGTLGIEEEIFIINETTKKLEAKSLYVLQKIGEKAGIHKSNWRKNISVLNENEELCLETIKKVMGIQAELPAAQLEMTSEVHKDVDSLINNMTSTRKYLAKLLNNMNCKMLFEPAPLINKNELEIFPRRRYLDITKKTR